MKVRVDPDACQGHGQCVMVCPEVFRADEQGFSYLESDEVSTALEAAVRKAERQCPERAISVVDG